MKAVILAGGLGSRLSEETTVKPKPMVEIGDKPILWHILQTYSSFGISDFVICTGYKGHIIKEYFASYFLQSCDVTFDLSSPNEIQIHNQCHEPWKVTVVDTGATTQTAGRLRRVRNYIDSEPFCFTYGDGVANINIKELLKTHYNSPCLVTVTAVRPPGRYGTLHINDSKVLNFSEKIEGESAWINGGFFVVDPQVLDLISGDLSVWETDVLPQLALSGQLACYRHGDFWQCMDTLRDKNYLNQLWSEQRAPWKTW